ncbi:MAG: hypothetical protein A2632_00650 [Candidatus Pacebacteria bacterium RIFCSPHIGHO2_01_FULL_46_16]|nr:MAG: hypothetical protein A2632_00650 [Candidatus Pacebacteria bacterium RIFCSPHIGHO2_01_FULL_46_16]OGJ21701.1 MAG: hypothetical protein A3J60_03635 [Candidatus Pacebacteria bacterium RIFCSPHIGHO2_02_FULL_46_9]OGJ38693.1 MAG: hypothetical protein A3A82_03110 [Candidatus Pacebacteria bacterium RIFCSPLOWO2_01_FULL_47_12]
MPEPDQLIGASKTIYETSFGEIFARNFVAGMARTLGGLFLYVIVLFLLGNLFLQKIWPILQPQLQLFQKLTSDLQGLPTLTQPKVGEWR